MRASTPVGILPFDCESRSECIRRYPGLPRESAAQAVLVAGDEPLAAEDLVEQPDDALRLVAEAIDSEQNGFGRELAEEPGIAECRPTARRVAQSRPLRAAISRLLGYIGIGHWPSIA